MLLQADERVLSEGDLRSLGPAGRASTAGVKPKTGAAATRGVSAAKPHSSATRCTAARWRRVTSVTAGGTPERQRPRAATSAAPGKQGNLTNSVRLSAVCALYQQAAMLLQVLRAHPSSAA